MDQEELFTLYESSSHLTLAEAFGVDSSCFGEIKISELEFSTRATNCFKNYKIKTIPDLLNITFKDLKEWTNCGRGTTAEILQKTENALKVLPEINKGNFSYGALIKTLCNDLLEYCTTEDDQIDAVLDLLSLFPDDYPNKEGFIGLVRELQEEKRNLELDSVSQSLPSYLMDKLIFPFAAAYSFITKTDFYKHKIPNGACFGNYSFESDFQSNEDRKKWIGFFKWVSADLNAILHSILFDNLDEKREIILSRVLAGDTLEQVGKVIEPSVGKQRVHQLLEKQISRIRFNIATHDIFPLLFGHMGGEVVVPAQRLHEVLDDETCDRFICLIRRGSFIEPNKWGYVKNYDALSFDFFGECNLSSIASAVAALPNIIENSLMDDYILSISQEINCDYKYILAEINSNFVQYNDFYSRYKFMVSEMYAYILKTKFRNGYSISDEKDYKDLCTYMNEQFRFDISQNSKRVVDNFISDVGIICGRGQYIHPCLLNIPDSIKDKILEYVEQAFGNGRTALPYGEIYSQLKGLFENTDITDPYVLHGIMTTMNFPYELSQFYVLKDSQSSFENDFTLYIKENYPIPLNKVIECFGFTNPQLLSVLGRCRNIKQLHNTLIYQR